MSEAYDVNDLRIIAWLKDEDAAAGALYNSFGTDLESYLVPTVPRTVQLPTAGYSCVRNLHLGQSWNMRLAGMLTSINQNIYVTKPGNVRGWIMDSSPGLQQGNYCWFHAGGFPGSSIVGGNAGYMRVDGDFTPLDGSDDPTVYNSAKRPEAGLEVIGRVLGKFSGHGVLSEAAANFNVPANSGYWQMLMWGSVTFTGNKIVSLVLKYGTSALDEIVLPGTDGYAFSEGFMAGGADLPLTVRIRLDQGGSNFDYDFGAVLLNIEP